MSLAFLALGDSYTIGEAVQPTERWPVQLARMVREQHGVDLADPRIVAQTGWTTAELAAAIGAASIVGAFDLVTLLIGVNNQYRGLSVEDYRREFRDLLQTAIGFARGDTKHVIVLSIPDWGATPFAADRDRGQIAREINAFNAANFDEAAREGPHYVDVTATSRANEPGLVASDGLHPSSEQYRRWAGLVARVVAGMFE
jgi:lysophospholipase L1-like esterase